MSAELTREGWLALAVEALRPVFAEIKVDLPASVAVSCGFPGGAPIRKTLGQCWKTAAANDGRSHLFVTPIICDSETVLGVLVHELIHAVDDCQSGHKGAFAKMARALGLEGKLTATRVGAELAVKLAEIIDAIGPYPHAGLSLEAKPTKTQGTRMLKVECPSCGYIVRTTAKWLELGTPTCVCGEQMEAAA